MEPTPVGGRVAPLATPERSTIVDLREPSSAACIGTDEVREGEGEEPVIALVDGRSDPEPIDGGNTGAAPAELDHEQTSSEN